MKISLDIDCTPEELRGFFGLPDVRPMQEQLLKEVEERLRAEPQGARPRSHAENLAARRIQGLRAIAGDVPGPDERPRRRQEIVVAVALRTPAAVAARMAGRGSRALLPRCPPIRLVMRYLRRRRTPCGSIAPSRIGGSMGSASGSSRSRAWPRLIGVVGLAHVRWSLPFHPGGRSGMAAGAILLGPRATLTRRRGPRSMMASSDSGSTRSSPLRFRPTMRSWRLMDGSA